MDLILHNLIQGLVVTSRTHSSGGECRMMLAQRGISPLVTLASYPDLKVQIFPSLSQVVWSNIQNVGKNDVIRLRIETEMESV